MHELVALDFGLVPELEQAIRDRLDNDEAFCVLDQRLSARARREQIVNLGATAVLGVGGRVGVPEGRRVDDEVGLVMLTSGSSGPAKAVELTWDALRASADLTRGALRCERASAWYPCLPANHIGGLAVLLRAILGDDGLVWGRGEDVATGPEHGATHVAVVKTQLARYDLSHYSTVLLGGAHPPRDRGDNVVTTWGMTETGSGVVYDGVALQGVDVASVDGELCVRSPTLFRSYRTSPRPSVRGPDGRDDWFPTGDGGSVVDGRISVHGRIGFVINSGGEKLWPEDLEAVLGGVEGVRDVAVTGVDDVEWGQRVVVLVVSDGTLRDDALRSAAAEHIGPWAKPKEIRHVVAIPRTDNGKIRRGDLANLF